MRDFDAQESFSRIAVIGFVVVAVVGLAMLGGIAYTVYLLLRHFGIA